MENKISPCIWFEKDLPQVIEYYQSIFKDNLKVVHLWDLENGPGGQYQFAVIELFGKSYDMLAAGPMFTHSEALSFVISCEDQAEVDYYWDALTANGGAESQCGWCRDKYGLSWQIEPKILRELSTTSDKEKRNYAMNAMFKMKKIIVKDLQQL